MKVSQGVHFWLDYHNLHSKKNTIRTYQSILFMLNAQFGERELEVASEQRATADRLDICRTH